MFEYITIFWVSFTIAFSGALAPGPFLTTVISESPKKGFKTAPLMILGHAIIEVVMMALLILGFAKFIDNAIILKTITVLGSLILIYFGIKMISSTPKLTLDTEFKKTVNSNLIFKGITMSLANPYWTIWWVTIGLGLVLGAQKVGFMALWIFFFGHILADLIWYSFVSYSISKGSKFLSEKAYKSLILICGTALIIFGILFFMKIFI